MIELASINICTGCAACANVCSHEAIEMQEDKEGFVFPHINQGKCVECNLCQIKCPVLALEGNVNSDTPETFAFWSILDRKKSSSGGAFSAIARWILGQNGIVFGAAYDESLNVQHISIDKVEDLNLLRGSKYMQSNINETFRSTKEILKANRWVLFTGTPCQIAGLKSYVGTKLAEKLILIDIACHGVPSQKIFKSYVTKLEKKCNTKISTLGFRKLDGWVYKTSIVANDKKKSLFGIENLYMYAFDRGSIFRQSCYTCPFANIPRQGDLTIADYWGIGRHGNKFNKSTMAGVSLILVNNTKGDKVLHKSISIVPHYIEKRNLQEAIVENGNLIAPSSLCQDRHEMITAFLDPEISLEEINNRFSLVPHGIAYTIKKYAVQLGVIDYVKECYSILKRL